MEPCNQVKQRGLSAAGWADNAKELAGMNLQVNIFERDQPIVGIRSVAQANIFQRQLRHRNSTFHSWNRGEIRPM